MVERNSGTNGRYTETLYRCKSSAGEPRVLFYFSVVFPKFVTGTNARPKSNCSGRFQNRPPTRVSLTLIRAKPYGGFAGLTMAERCLSEPA
jgi:hypothetical protein